MSASLRARSPHTGATDATGARALSAPPAERPLGIAGAGIALCAAYVVMLAAVYVLTRRVFAVPFEWGRLGTAVLVIAGFAIAGELALPTAGPAGFAARALTWAAIPLALVLSRVLPVRQLTRFRASVRS